MMGAKLLERIPKLDTKSWKSDQGIGSLVTFVVAALLLGVSVVIGLVLVSKVFMKPPTAKFLTELGLGFLAPSGEVLNVGEAITLAIVFLLGMIVGGVNTYIFNNQALQKVVNGYAWLCAGFGLYVYLKVAANFYTRGFIFSSQFPKYLLALAVITAAVYVLPLLFTRYNVRPYATLVFVGNFLHLMLILSRNIFVGSGNLENPFFFRVHFLFSYLENVYSKIAELQNEKLGSLDIGATLPFKPSLGPDVYFFAGDIVLFIIMIYIAVSLVRNAPVMGKIKRQLDRAFAPHE
jgi:hypothetical protein